MRGGSEGAGQSDATFVMFPRIFIGSAWDICLTSGGAIFAEPGQSAHGALIVAGAFSPQEQAGMPREEEDPL